MCVEHFELGVAIYDWAFFLWFTLSTIAKFTLRKYTSLSQFSPVGISHLRHKAQFVFFWSLFFLFTLSFVSFSFGCFLSWATAFASFVCSTIFGVLILWGAASYDNVTKFTKSEIFKFGFSVFIWSRMPGAVRKPFLPFTGRVTKTYQTIVQGGLENYLHFSDIKN